MLSRLRLLGLSETVLPSSGFAVPDPSFAAVHVALNSVYDVSRTLYMRGYMYAVGARCGIELTAYDCRSCDSKGSTISDIGKESVSTCDGRSVHSYKSGESGASSDSKGSVSLSRRS
jgi:hypothetical protein